MSNKWPTPTGSTACSSVYSFLRSSKIVQQQWTMVSSKRRPGGERNPRTGLVSWPRSTPWLEQGWLQFAYLNLFDLICCSESVDSGINSQDLPTISNHSVTVQQGIKCKLCEWNKNIQKCRHWDMSRPSTSHNSWSRCVAMIASTLFRRGQQDSQLQDAASLKFQEVHVVARLFSGKSHHLAILHSLSLARQNMMVIHIQPNATLPVTGASPRIIWCTTSGDEFTIVLLRLTIWKMRWQFFMLFKIPAELPVWLELLSLSKWLSIIWIILYNADNLYVRGIAPHCTQNQTPKRPENWVILYWVYATSL